MRRILYTLGLILIAAFIVIIVKPQVPHLPSKSYNNRPIMPFILESPAFQNGQSLPARYTCDGSGQSPPLTIRETPPAAKSLALIAHDPDAPRGEFVHWLIWNMPPDTHSIPEGGTPTGSVQGTTDADEQRYVGACPPSGTHRYVFTAYALDTLLDLPPSTRKSDLMRAMEGHILGQAELMGTYARK